MRLFIMSAIGAIYLSVVVVPIILKLSGAIGLQWAYVLWPIWGAILSAVFFVGIVAFFLAVANHLEISAGRRKRARFEQQMSEFNRL